MEERGIPGVKGLVEHCIEEFKVLQGKSATSGAIRKFVVLASIRKRRTLVLHDCYAKSGTNLAIFAS